MLTVPALFVDRCRRTPDQLAFEAPDGEGGWTTWTWAEAERQGSGLVRRLYSLGVDEGVPVAIVAHTSQEWSAVDMAVLCLGGITVGIYPNLLPQQIVWQLAHSEAQVLVVEDEAMFLALEPHLEELFDLRHTFAIRGGERVPELTPAEDDLAFLRKRAESVGVDEIATIVYTSGTTGEPKGVVLRHRHLSHVIEATQDALPTRPGDRSIIFLPLAHVLQRVTLYRGLAEEAVGTYAPSIEALPETLLHARPHVLATVPRMLEKIRSRAEARAERKSPRARQVLDWAMATGAEIHRRERAGERVGFRDRAKLELAERLVYRKVRDGLGGRLRLLISGGAALDPELAGWFEAMGISVREGWGLSETAAPATLNTEAVFKLGTVGPALPGVELKIASDGEVLVRGAGTFEEYWKNPEATAAAFTSDGFFKTGDLGELDGDGFLSIRGRKKEILVTAGGKNVAPVPIEQKLEGGLVDQAVVLGNERPYLIALISLDEEALAELARHQGWVGGVSEWRERIEVEQRLLERVEAVNSGLNSWETVKRWTVLPEAMTVDNGQLTATLKKRRSVIEAAHSELIEAIYARPR